MPALSATRQTVLTQPSNPAADRAVRTLQRRRFARRRLRHPRRFVARPDAPIGPAIRAPRYSTCSHCMRCWSGRPSVYRPMSRSVEAVDDVQNSPLQHSRRLVYGLAALFGLDLFGTGFLVQSLLALGFINLPHFGHSCRRRSCSGAVSVRLLPILSPCRSPSASGLSTRWSLPICRRTFCWRWYRSHRTSRLRSVCCSRAVRCRRWMCRPGLLTSWRCQARGATGRGKRHGGAEDFAWAAGR